ncbi:hypothetical protein ACB092_03G239100 [Castanea dentata]
MDLKDGSGSYKVIVLEISDESSSKHSETYSGSLDESGSSEKFEIHPSLIIRTQRSKHEETHTHADFIDRSGSSKHSEIHSVVIDGSGSSKYSETRSDVIDLTNFIDGSGSNSSFLNPNRDTPHEAIEEETHISTPVSDIGHESVVQQSMSPTQSPKIQVMDRSVGYDPSRIPRSVFETSKSTMPMDWSVASNDSLFSLHVGNNSFSKDHMFLFGDFKSGELSKSGELIRRSPIPSVPKEEIDRKKIKIGGVTLEVDENSNNTAKESTEAQNLQNVPRPAVSRNSSSPSRNSDDTRNSAESFAFPVFAVVESTAVFNADEEQWQQQKPLSPKVASKSTAKRWFSCLSWLQRGGSYCSRVHCHSCAHCC